MAKCNNCTNLYNLSDENDVIVGKWCPKINDSPDIEAERECRNYKRMTNADRIRAMSDAELAEHFSELIKDTYENEYCKDVNDWLKWLQSEVEEVNNPDHAKRPTSMERKYAEDIYREKAMTVAIQSMEKLQEYEKLGTLEEVREAVEKQKAKKPIIQPWSPARCPTCGEELSENLGDGYYRHRTFLERCTNVECAQRLDWSEEE